MQWPGGALVSTAPHWEPSAHLGPTRNDLEATKCPHFAACQGLVVYLPTMLWDFLVWTLPFFKNTEPSPNCEPRQLTSSAKGRNSGSALRLKAVLLK